MEKETPFEKRSCYDCSFIVGYVSLWCSNEQAVKDRGTAIPGCIHCPYWQPDWAYVKEKYHTPENGYVPRVGFLQRFKKFIWI